jgi:hypothetical protein
LTQAALKGLQLFIVELTFLARERIMSICVAGGFLNDEPDRGVGLQQGQGVQIRLRIMPGRLLPEVRYFQPRRRGNGPS